jgi:tetratricopeptide (TPR) repeat protein
MPARNPCFTGENLLESLRKMLCESKQNQHNHQVALQGLGGIGKTRIAAEYVYRYHGELYQSVFWINASNQATLLQGFRNIADETKCVKIDEIADLTPDKVVQRVRRWLEQEDRWLLVLDNLDDVRALEGFKLPITGLDRHILITTRYADAASIWAKGFKVHVLEPHDAVRLLMREITQTDPPNDADGNYAAKIVRRLGYLPLAIVQAAAYIRQASTISAFLAIYEKHRKMLHDRREVMMDYNESVGTTWLINFEIVRSQSPIAIKLLQLFAFLNPDGILIKFLQAGIRGLYTDPDLQQALDGEHDAEMNDALLQLTQYSLIERSNDKESINIHRLVQAVTQDQMSQEEEQRYMNMAVAIFSAAFPEDITSDTRLRCRLFQGQIVDPLLEKISLLSEEVASIAERVAHFLRNDGIYRDSIRLQQMTVNVCEMLFSKKEVRTLGAMNDLANVYYDNGNLKEAEKLHKEVLAAHKEILGENHPDTLKSMNNLATVYHDNGNLKEAEQMYKEVLAGCKEILGENHPNTLTGMNNLANVYHDNGNLKEAEQMYKEVLAARKEILGENHPNTLTSMNNLATVYCDNGNLKEAEQMYKEVLVARKEILGENHPDTLKSMNNLADVYRDNGDWDKAEQIHKMVSEFRNLV